MKILVINAGSSSLKYQLFDMDNEKVLAKGLCERIGIDGHLKHTPLVDDKPVYEAEIAMPTHAESIASVIDILVSAEYGVISSMDEIGAVGHRVVHGGQKFSASVLIDENVLEAIKDCIPLGPLHIPANLMGINACTKAMPSVPQVAVFDTAFHQTMPEKAFIYPIPYEYYEKHDVRRYGFHGTSHRYVSAQAVNALEVFGISKEDSKVITCHLGNGSSLAAVKSGISVDTSMGLTPLEGVPMGTRCGNIDPAIVEYICGIEGIDAAAAVNMLNKKAGILGVSGISSDLRDVCDAAAEGNERAQLAIDVFTHSVRKSIASYAASMGGVDAVVFTAGIGENSSILRKAIVEGLEFMGIKIDENANKYRGDFLDISADDATVRVFVIATNEELVIARDTKEIVGK